MSNKQPFYHSAVVAFHRDRAVRLEEASRFLARVAFPGLVPHTMEIDGPAPGPAFGVLFTATREIDARELQVAIEGHLTQDPHHPVVVVVFECDAEPGDPADLL